MPIKINSYGGILTWWMRKNFSFYTTKLALEFTSKRYENLINNYIQTFSSTDKIPLFKMVNIETINRCNGTCAFCPANVRDEKRELKKMSQPVFEKIIDELKELKWEGQIFLNVNNEPFLDKDIVRRAAFIREQLGSKAIISMFTNGTLLSIDKLDELSGIIDVLIINNYSKIYRLNSKNREIYNYVKRNPERFKSIDITINRRYSEEILATRAGNAPNKKKKNNNVDSACIYPYTDITIFPDGKVGLCCNDCFEITDYGNVSEESLRNIWENEKFEKSRELMRSGRCNMPFCQECDVVDTGFRENLIKGIEKQNITEIKKTDWTAYYLNPKSRFSAFTQKFTLQKIIYYIEKYADASIDIMELGGGNSCFAESLIKSCKVPIKSYSIIDNCEIGVSKFKQMNIQGDAYLADLAVENSVETIGKQYDVVYSIGLIEHFRGKEIEQIIKAHFSLCKENGIVLISVPTPTIQYRFTRKLMEKLNVWGFPDEKALTYGEIEEFLKKGTIVEKKINYKLPLTQLMIVAVKGKYGLNL